MVLQNQSVVSNLQDAKRDRLKVEGSPMTTRSGLKLGEFMDVSTTQWTSAGQDVVAGVDDAQRQRQYSNSSRPWSWALSNADSDSSAASFSSGYDETIPKADPAKVADEQVVNTAAYFLPTEFIRQ